MDVPRLLVVTVALVVLGWCLGTARAEETKPPFDHARLAQHALERHIRPGYQGFARATEALAQAMPEHCQAMTEASRREIEKRFDMVVTAWGRIEHIGFGPVVAGQRFDRIMFWPDRRGIGARQIAKALRDQDTSVLDPHKLAQKSIAIQGLPALEAVLFGDDGGHAEDPSAAAHRCGFAAAIAANLAEMAGALSTEWTGIDGFAKDWLSPGPGNAHFLKPEETTLALARALDLGLERVRDQYLGGPLGLTPQRRKLPPVLGKSGRTMRLVVAHIAGLRSIYVEGGLEQALIDAKGADAVNTTELARLVEKEIITAEKGAAALIDVKSPFEGEAAQRIIALGFPLRNARVIAAQLLSAVTDMPLGFNASDGD
jgi:predicted lipoprotein